MKSSKETNEFKILLKEKGHRVTPSRVAILSILKEKHIPLSAEAIQKKLKGKKPDQATIYRTLTSFEKSGIIKRVDLHKDEVYFEMADDHHHHLVCTSCGTIEDFETCDIDSLTKKIIANSSKFNLVKQHSLELFGLCTSCVKK